MMKRILSLLLAFLVAIGTIPVSTYATDAPVVIVVPSEEATEPTAEAVIDSPCATCGHYDCASDHLTWCSECKKDNCGESHTEMITEIQAENSVAMIGTATGGENANSQYRVNIGKKATFNPIYLNGGSFPISDDPGKESSWSDADQLFGSDLPAELTVVILDVYDNGSEYWYKVAAAEGYVLPDALAAQPWVFQNSVGDSPDSDSLVILEETGPDEPEDPENPCAVFVASF